MEDIKIKSAFPKSSNISQVDFDPFMKTMTVGFSNGTIYEYYGVSSELYETLVSAPSIGKFFMNEIKNKFDFAKRGQLASIVYTNSDGYQDTTI